MPSFWFLVLGRTLNCRTVFWALGPGQDLTLPMWGVVSVLFGPRQDLKLHRDIVGWFWAVCGLLEHHGSEGLPQSLQSSPERGVA